TGRALVWLELRISGVAELDRSVATLNGEDDGNLLDRDDLADKLREVGNRTALLARVDGEKRLLLRFRDLVVEVDGGRPVALQDVAGNVRDHRDRPAGDVDAVDRPLVEMPRNDRVAGAEVRILADPARTQHATVADFE